MKLFDNEEVLKESADKTIILSTHRIRKYERGNGDPNMISILLQEVCSIKMKYEHNVFLLIAGFILLIISVSDLIRLESLVGILAAGTGVFLIILYFVTRRYEMAIESAASSIQIIVKGMSRNEVEDFIDAVELAKDKKQAYIKS